MKKYVIPSLECVQFKLSDCIALCDGSCPTTGDYWQQNASGQWELVHLTALTVSMGV